MSMFKGSELVRLGFELIEEGGTKYYQYLLNPSDYFYSPYMATNDDRGEDSWEVENTILTNVDRGFLLRGEIEKIINISKERFRN